MRTKPSATDKTLKNLEKLRGYKSTFGSLVRSHRLCDKVSQTELAHKVGISRQQICDIENDRKPVSANRAVEIAQALGYPEHIFVQYALQDGLDRANLNYEVKLIERKKPRRRLLKKALA